MRSKWGVEAPYQHITTTDLKITPYAHLVYLKCSFMNTIVPNLTNFRSAS